jgi:dynein heavy chain
MIIYNCLKYPLIIDPDNQANNWIKKSHSLQQLQVTQLYNPKFMRHLENCIQFGQQLLIEDIETELEPILDSILLKSQYKKGNQYYIKLAEVEFPFHNEFRLYMTSKLDNPVYLPDVSIKVLLFYYRSPLSTSSSQDKVWKNNCLLKSSNTREMIWKSRDRILFSRFSSFI